MSTKTYALFDVIGVKRAFATGKAATVLQAFWQATDAWTNGTAPGFPPMRLAGRNAVQAPDAFVTTFSDSALLSTDPEFEIAEFWRLVDSLKSAIDRAAGASYVIVNTDNQVAHHTLPALGAVVVGGNDLQPRYMNAGGSGPAFVNLFLADEQVKQQVKNHGWQNYSVYAIGQRSLPPGAKPVASVTFTGLGGVQQDLHALR